VADGYFDRCAPGNLVCLCNLEQSEVTRYVNTVQPCLDASLKVTGEAGCTAGAVYRQSSTQTNVNYADANTMCRIQTAPDRRLRPVQQDRCVCADALGGLSQLDKPTAFTFDMHLRSEAS
jgi:hypothetical protein